jgi:hypothetical protein
MNQKKSNHSWVGRVGNGGLFFTQQLYFITFKSNKQNVIKIYKYEFVYLDREVRVGGGIYKTR